MVSLPGFFFFQAEDGIRGFHVTGVQTCALPISPEARGPRPPVRRGERAGSRRARRRARTRRARAGPRWPAAERTAVAGAAIVAAEAGVAARRAAAAARAAPMPRTEMRSGAAVAEAVRAVWGETWRAAPASAGRMSHRGRASRRPTARPVCPAATAAVAAVAR